MERWLGTALGIALPAVVAARLASAPAPVHAEASRARVPPPITESTARRVAVARPSRADVDEAPVPRIILNEHVEKSGRKIEYELIARRPERPAAYGAYCYPVVGAPVVSGYDLDKPDRAQRRGSMPMVGHGGVDLLARKGTPIAAPLLEDQVGDAEVLFVGWLYGETVVTRHAIREGGREHDYLLFFAHLDRAAAGVIRGVYLRHGALLGYVGDTASPELEHLHLEARRVRDDIDPWSVLGWELHARDVSIVTDPRNLLPLRDPETGCAH